MLEIRLVLIFMLMMKSPVLKDASYEKIYDKNLKKDRYYLTLTVYDNHYAQSITPILFTSNESYTFLTENQFLFIVKRVRIVKFGLK